MHTGTDVHMADPDPGQVTTLAEEFAHVKALEPVALDPKRLAFEALKLAATWESR